MQVSHGVSAVFDDPNLVSSAGLVPVVSLAERCGLSEFARKRLTLSGDGAANAYLKVPALIGGMAAGADSIDDMDLLRHGGMDRVFAGIRAPSTLGTFLRSFTFGHVRQLDGIASRFLTNLAGHTPLLPSADRVAFVDIDDTVRETHGYAKQAAGYGYSGVAGLNALIGTVSSPLAAPVIAASRLRRGAVNSARGAARFVAETLANAIAAGAGGLIITRADSAFYNAEVIAAIRRAGAHFSITARMDPGVTAAIARIDQDAWIPIQYPNAIFDDDEGRWISEADVAEIDYTAFTSRAKSKQVTARLIVRRVKRLGPATSEQGELFAAYRYHAVFTDSPFAMLAAESDHRGHAIVEQVIADLKSSALAHLPSASFAANSAWLVCAAMAFNLTRAAGALASTFHAKATTATIRAQLITVPARIARSARRLVLHLPSDWPWEHDFTDLFNHATAPNAPPAAA